MSHALSSARRDEYDHSLELDCAYELPGEARFRVNVHQQRGYLGASLRIIPVEVPKLADLHLPPVLGAIPKLTHGLVLVTGPTGSGKSTTLAALIGEINATREDHIVTIEDPIEFVHPHDRSVVTQREVGRDTRSFPEALRRVLRMDPDVILVGEMRDRETMSVALNAANTGHLVLATLHTFSAKETITRIIESFPGEERDAVRAQLSGTLRAIITQALCVKKNKIDRIVATEVLVATPAVRTLIREGKVNQLQSTMQAGRSFGMQTMSESLTVLSSTGEITLAEAVKQSPSIDELANAAGFPSSGTLLRAAGMDTGIPSF